MKSKQVRQQEAIQRNLRHVSKYIEQALKTVDQAEQLAFVKHKLGIPKQNSDHNANIRQGLHLMRKQQEAA